ncbi:MAG: glycosyltransferase family 1 protein [Bacillaceae bacterium]
MEPIRVLQVVTHMNRGGLETMLMNYYRKMDRTKIQFDFMVNRQERGDYDDEIESLGGRIFRMLPIRPGNYRKYFKQLDEFFSTHKEYQVVHAHINENSGFVLRAAKKVGIPCRIAHSHLADLHIDYKYPFRLYGRMNLKQNTNHYFACSKQAGQWLFGANEKVTVLNNAVDTEAFHPNEQIRQQIRTELQIEDKLVIGHVGRFNKQKNHAFLIDIFNEVYKQNKNAVLLLIGQGTLMDDIKEKVASLGLNDAVKFLGLRSNIADMMQAMDIFLFPSLFEGLPVVLVEAQAAGLTCITSTGVTEEANITKEVMYLSLQASPKEWADAVLHANCTKNDYTPLLIENGYDVATNMEWLRDFYLKQIG